MMSAQAQHYSPQLSRKMNALDHVRRSGDGCECERGAKDLAAAFALGTVDGDHGISQNGSNRSAETRRSDEGETRRISAQKNHLLRSPRLRASCSLLGVISGQPRTHTKTCCPVNFIFHGEHEDRTDWMGQVDFTDRKMKFLDFIIANHRQSSSIIVNHRHLRH